MSKKTIYILLAVAVVLIGTLIGLKIKEPKLKLLMLLHLPL